MATLRWHLPQSRRFNVHCVGSSTIYSGVGKLSRFRWLRSIRDLIIPNIVRSDAIGIGTRLTDAPIFATMFKHRPSEAFPDQSLAAATPAPRNHRFRFLLRIDISIAALISFAFLQPRSPSVSSTFQQHRPRRCFTGINRSERSIELSNPRRIDSKHRHAVDNDKAPHRCDDNITYIVAMTS